MSYVSTYWLDCEQNLAYDPACVVPEFGKVRSAGFIRKKYLPTLLAAPTSNAVWQTGIDMGKLFLVQKVSGSFDPGEPVALKGYGKRLYTRGPREMTLSFSDPSFIRNYAYYNRIHTFTDLVPFFRTEKYIQIADRPADIIAKDAVEEDMESIVDWDVFCKWRGVDLPRLIDASGLSIFYPAATGTVHRIFGKPFSKIFA